MNNILQVKHISKTFINEPVIKDVTFSLERGQIGCLLGPSGCGKTTLLRIIAGFESPDRGTVILHGRTVYDKNAVI